MCNNKRNTNKIIIKEIIKEIIAILLRKNMKFVFKRICIFWVLHVKCNNRMKNEHYQQLEIMQCELFKENILHKGEEIGLLQEEEDANKQLCNFHLLLLDPSSLWRPRIESWTGHVHHLQSGIRPLRKTGEPPGKCKPCFL